MMNLTKIIAEFVGTFVFIGVVLSSGEPIPIGLALAVVIFLIGKVSGGHFNPAVSIMFYLQKSLSSNDLLPYIGAQILGGVAAYYFFNMTEQNK